MSQTGKRNFPRLIYFAGFVNVIAAVAISAFLKKLLIPEERVNFYNSVYLMIGVGISALLLVTGFIVRSKMYGAKSAGFDDHDKSELAVKTSRGGYIAIAVVIIIIEAALSWTMFGKANAQQSMVISKRNDVLSRINQELADKNEDYEVKFSDQKTYSAIIISKTLSNLNEKIMMKVRFNKQDEPLLYPSNVDGYYIMSDLEPIFVVDSLNLFMDEISKLPYKTAPMAGELAFNPTKSQYDLLSETIRTGKDNSGNIVFSEEKRKTSQGEAPVRFTYSMENAGQKDAVKPELHVMYYIGNISKAKGDAAADK